MDEPARPNSIRQLRELLGGGGLGAVLARGGLGSMSVIGSQMVLAFLTSIVLARSLGAEGYGIYAYVLTLVNVLAVAAQFGLPVLLVRETAKAESSADWPRLVGIWRWSAIVAGTTSAAILLTGAAIAWRFSETFTSLQLRTFSWALLLVPLIALSNLAGGALRGLRRAVLGQLPSSVIRPGLFLVSLLCFVYWLRHGALTPSLAMAFHVMAAALALVIGAALLARARPADYSSVQRAVLEHRRWLRSALPLCAVAAVGLLNQQTDVLMLGLFVGAEDVGSYRVASQSAQLVSLGLTAIGVVTMPHFARLHQRREMKRFQRLATTSARAVAAIALPLTVVFIVLGEPFLATLFGVEFAEAYPVLATLAVAHLLHASFGTIGPLLNMAGHEQATVRAIAVAAACNVVLNLAMIPLFGALGAAIATALTLLIWNSLLWYAARSRLGVDSTALGALSRV